MKKKYSILVVLAVVSLLLSSCYPKTKNPGRDWFPDMRYSNAYETYSSQDYYLGGADDTITARLPINGTIPRGYLPANWKIRSNINYLRPYLLKDEMRGYNNMDSMFTYTYELASTFKNPFPYTASNLARGKEVYQKNCMVCHGEKGEGDGSIVEQNGVEGPYTARPPAYSGKLPNLNDGQIYHTISYGKGNMNGYRSQITQEDRWKLIYYIKSLAGIKETAAADDNTAFNAQSIESASVGSELKLDNIYYDVNSAALNYDSYNTLDKLVAFLDANPSMVVEIGSHTDNTGSPATNMVLSNKRAQTVVGYLKSAGISRKNLVAKGYGETNPAVACTECTEAQNQLNRRTTIKILAK